jgi:predicted AAA+ superfamily ATPase
MWIDRYIEPILQNRAETRPVVVLTGARQTGKTSLVRRLFPDYRYVSLDLPSEALQAEQDPAGFMSRYPAPLIVDEVQYAPGLFRHLKRVIDDDRDTPGQFILTGSQPFQLMQGVSESLAGRAALLQLSGLSYAEILSSFPELSVEEAMVRGGYPELYAKPELDPDGFYQSYVATYLERDLRSQLQVGNLSDFERFLRAGALRTAQLINKAELARDVGISPSTAGQWSSVLERSGVWFLLEPWFSNRTKSLVKSPKLHFQDSGLCAFLMGIRSVDDLAGSPLAGTLWETMVFTEIQRLLSVGIGSWQFNFWRDRTKEADFLLHRAGTFMAADAKWAEHPSRSGRLKSIIKELSHCPQAALICRTPNRYPMSDTIQALPLADLPLFLDQKI